MQFDIKKVVRPNIEKLKPYSSAKDEFNGEARILLDANENSLGSPLTKWYNRYPDPYQKEIKEKGLDAQRAQIKKFLLDLMTLKMEYNYIFLLVLVSYLTRRDLESLYLYLLLYFYLSNLLFAYILCQPCQDVC
jgi:hypothetical protein